MDRLVDRPDRPSGNSFATGLSTVNWLLLMAMLSALLLATTVSQPEPTGSASEVGTTATR